MKWYPENSAPERVNIPNHKRKKPPAARGPHGMGDLFRPSAIEKASLNEWNRRECNTFLNFIVLLRRGL
jgi:hypothetical protein